METNDMQIEEMFFNNEIDRELIDNDFDTIDPYGEIMEDDDNGHTLDYVDLQGCQTEY